MRRWAPLDFFRFRCFFSKLKNHITHFQLRNLVVCASLDQGIFYPSVYHHDDNLQATDAVEDCHQLFRINRLAPDPALPTRATQLEYLVDAGLLANPSSRVSSMAVSPTHLAVGTFEGGCVLVDLPLQRIAGEYCLLALHDGITNHLLLHSDIVAATNDRLVRVLTYDNRPRHQVRLPFAANCIVARPDAAHEYLLVGDDTAAYTIDTRTPGFRPTARLAGHTDFGFGCDWSPVDAHLVVTGNQDGTVRLWDRRKAATLHCWSSALGLPAHLDAPGGPVRNCKFSHSGHIAWAESLDHVGVLRTSELARELPRVQLVDFIGKCIGLNVCPSPLGELLVVGVNDCPLGGIITYEFEAAGKPLDFDFSF